MIAFFLLIGLIIYDALVWGFITLKFYIWFILPVFNTLPQITLLQAIGISFFIALFKNITPPIKDSDDLASGVSNLLIIPWIALGIAYLFKLIVGI